MNVIQCHSNSRLRHWPPPISIVLSAVPALSQCLFLTFLWNNYCLFLFLFLYLARFSFFASKSICFFYSARKEYGRHSMAQEEE